MEWVDDADTGTGIFSKTVGAKEFINKNLKKLSKAQTLLVKYWNLLLKYDCSSAAHLMTV